MSMTTTTKIAISTAAVSLVALGYSAMLVHLIYRGVVKGEAFQKPTEDKPPVNSTENIK